MPTIGRDGADAYYAPGEAGMEPSAEHRLQENHGSWRSDYQPGGGGGGGGSRKKRRRQRPQRSNRRKGEGESRGPQIDLISRERMFQDLEGLLRQIREQAEEIGDHSEAKVSELAHAVATFTRGIEEQSELSDRVRSEYQRLRDRLAQTLKTFEAAPRS